MDLYLPWTQENPSESDDENFKAWMNTNEMSAALCHDLDHLQLFVVRYLCQRAILENNRLLEAASKEKS